VTTDKGKEISTVEGGYSGWGGLRVRFPGKHAVRWRFIAEGPFINTSASTPEVRG
jgi:hypothetical protein